MVTKEELVILFSAKESRRDTTNRAYAQRMVSLLKGYMIYKNEESLQDNWEFLKNVGDVIYLISKVPNKRKDKNGDYPLPSAQTQIGYLNPIIEYLKLTDDFIVADEYKKYKDVIDDKIINNYQKSNLSLSQKENMISYEDLIKYLDKIDEEIKIYESKGFISHLDEWAIQDLKNLKVLMRLYLLYPSRNEYSSLRFITLRDYKKLKEPELNYVVLSQKRSFISITNYKTSKKYGVKITDIKDKELLKLLRNLKLQRDKVNDDKLFILAKTGEGYDNHNVSAIMSKWSNKLIGKSLGSTIIYKIVIKEIGLSYADALEKNDDELAIFYNKVLKKYADTRGHSQKVQKSIYITNDDS